MADYSRSIVEGSVPNHRCSASRRQIGIDVFKINFKVNKHAYSLPYLVCLKHSRSADAPAYS